MNVFAVAAAGQDRGWGNLLALILTGAAFAFAVSVHRRWKASRDQDFSPALPSGSPDGIKPQVSGPVDPVDPTGDPVEQKWIATDVAVADPGPTNSRRAELDAFVADRIATDRPAQIIQEARRRIGASSATVKRAIRRIRDERQAQS